MKTKKILSVLFALVMTLSLGVVAFADDDNWTLIPTSPSGLSDGEYYLDFTDLFTSTMSDPNEINAYITAYNGGTWYIDYAAKKLKGTIADPNDQSPAVFDPAMGTVLLMQRDVLRQVGATWTKIEKCTTGNMLDLESLCVFNGDLYVDVSAATGDLAQIMEQADWYVNPGSSLLEYKIVFGTETVYLPLMDENFGSWLTVCPVLTYNDGFNWTRIPTSPAGLTKGQYYLDFTDFLTRSANAQGGTVSPAMLAAEIAVYNSGEYYVDFEHGKMKGSFVVPGAYTASGLDETQRIPANGGGAWLPYVLYEVGAQWLPVTKSTFDDPMDVFLLGVENGDYFIDVKHGASEITSFLSKEELEIYVNPGSAWMEYKLVYGEQVMYYPLFSEIGFYFDECPIKQYDDGYNWTLLPKSADGLSDGDYYIDVEGYVDILVDDNGDPLSDAERAENLAFWGAADYYLDAGAMAMRITVYVPDVDENGNPTGEYIKQYIGVESADGYLPLLLKEYHEPEQPDKPDEPESPFQRLIKGITSFFLRVVDFFKKLFNVK